MKIKKVLVLGGFKMKKTKHTIKQEFLTRLEKIRKEKGIPFKNIEELRRIIENKPIRILFKGKKITIKDYSVCSNIFSQIRGLMFRSSNYKKPLLFVWQKKEKRAIHSFFCRKFLAIWFDNSRIIDVKIVRSYKYCVIPEEKFNMLLEIPFNYFKENKNLSSVVRKI